MAEYTEFFEQLQRSAAAKGSSSEMEDSDHNEDKGEPCLQETPRSIQERNEVVITEYSGMNTEEMLSLTENSALEISDHNSDRGDHSNKNSGE